MWRVGCGYGWSWCRIRDGAGGADGGGGAEIAGGVGAVRLVRGGAGRAGRDGGVARHGAGGGARLFQDVHRFGGEDAEWRLRGAIQHHRRIGYVLAGSDASLIRAMLGAGRAFYELFDLLHFGPMNQEYFGRWIDERLAGAGLSCPGLGARAVVVAGPRTRDVVRVARASYEVIREESGGAVGPTLCCAWRWSGSWRRKTTGCASPGTTRSTTRTDASTSLVHVYALSRGPVGPLRVPENQVHGSCMRARGTGERTLNGEIPMPLLIGPAFQSQADALRELLTADASLQLFGVEILRASADETAIFVRARTRGRTLTVAEGHRWRESSVAHLAVNFRQEIIADFYASVTADHIPLRAAS